MIKKTISADYLRHHFKAVVQKVLSGEIVTLKYGHLGEIELVGKNNQSLTKGQKLIKKLKARQNATQTRPIPSYDNNAELYADLYLDDKNANL